MDGLHLVPVATGLSDFEAKLLTAQLGADGILWQTRGIVDSIYPFGGIDVLVPREQLDEATLVLALVTDRAPVEATAATPGVPVGGAALLPVETVGDGRPPLWVGLAAAALVLAVATVRVLALW